MSEKEIYSDGELRITTHRFICPKSTYAVSNIASVKMEREPVGRGCAIVLLLIACVISVLGISGKVEIKGEITGGAILVSAVLLLAVLCFKDKYHVVVVNNSGEAKAVTDTDKQYIERVVNAVEEAISRR